MICQTVIKNGKNPGQLSRDDVMCKIIYVSQVHPGGWVPTAALRHVYKREYPKFLRNFTEYVEVNVGTGFITAMNYYAKEVVIPISVVRGDPFFSFSYLVCRFGVIALDIIYFIYVSSYSQLVFIVAVYVNCILS
ncbi:unnamed protein product [Cylicostephanus goldi]|uniref:START domain-containing protein n=1 Tax=Cylicostephanus goldi TaxID=71465 RepID=A0A3P6RLZ9_CYLGO|nr:unnamed protein product [Cylicostephanus goldi]